MTLNECRRKFAQTEEVARIVSFGPDKAKVAAHAQALRQRCAKLEADARGPGGAPEG